MTELKTKLLMCSIRTVGVVIGLWILGALVRYFGITYTDVKAVLGIINAYAPELVLIGLLSAAGIGFYHATMSDATEFDFMNFFVAGKPEDIFKLGYFALLLVSIWAVFALIWRDRLTEGYLGIILGAFIAKGMMDTAGKSWGTAQKPKEGG